ncbi:MAG: hypothetical protein K1X29_01915 [Bdellovibrionales bacterium]|nr:hypothetical protein [Bdellovibrionales bacterium]
MKLLFFVSCICCSLAVHGQSEKAKFTLKIPECDVRMKWNEISSVLIKMKTLFQNPISQWPNDVLTIEGGFDISSDKRTTEQELKTKLFPNTNVCLSLMQSLPSGEEKKMGTQIREAQIKLVVELLVNAFQYDYNTSTVSTVLLHYKKFIEIYERNLRMIEAGTDANKAKFASSVRNAIKEWLNG